VIARTHIAAAVASRQQTATEPAQIRLYRTVDEMQKNAPAAMLSYDDLQRLPQLKNLSAINCHNGQRKLTLSVLEFLALSLEKLGSDKPFILVYAGASGLATTVAATLFPPNVRFVLYDKAPNTIELISAKFKAEHVAIHTVKHAVPDTSRRVVVYREWFDDAEALKFAAMQGVTNVLFASDVRGDATDELSIAKDMCDQARWAVLTGSLAYMFKFRIPYEWTPEIRRAYDALPGDLRDAASRVPGATTASQAQPRSSSSSSSITYLDGEAYIQLYGRPNTVELRLIGFPKLTTKTKTYACRTISRNATEDAMATFNTFYRSHAAFWFGRHSHTFFKASFPGYDAVAEFCIASRVNSVLPGKGSSMEELRETITSMSDIISRFIQDKSTPEACSVRMSTAKHVHHRPDERTLPIAKKYVDLCRSAINLHRLRPSLIHVPAHLPHPLPPPPPHPLPPLPSAAPASTRPPSRRSPGAAKGSVASLSSSSKQAAADRDKKKKKTPRVA
jgi:hypothetical protein